jgi:hypothetical protein
VSDSGWRGVLPLGAIAQGHARSTVRSNPS